LHEEADMTATTTLDLPTGPLVDPATLAARLGHPRLRVLDVRGRHPSSALPAAKLSEYEVAHIPGAVFVDWTRDFVNLADPVPYQLAGAEAFSTSAAALGVAEDDVIVTYDDYYGIHAARVAWAFRCYGFEAKVLDGGWRTWTEEGHSTTADPTPLTPTALLPQRQSGLRLSLEELEVARAQGAVLVDARPRHLYLGEPGLAGTGHVPGALSFPYQELVDGATGRFQAPDAVRRLAAATGIDTEGPACDVIAMCGIGVSATVAMIALEMVGVTVRGVYDGSWSEWSADRMRPVAYGARPG
jgi:thiosulfate/3-mercaptopyruvate sulfurtransferase